MPQADKESINGLPTSDDVTGRIMDFLIKFLNNLKEALQMPNNNTVDIGLLQLIWIASVSLHRPGQTVAHPFLYFL